MLLKHLSKVVIVRCTDEWWDTVIAIDQTSVFYMTREALPWMEKAGAGSIVNVSSILGQYGGSCETAYSATKGAVIAFTRGLAKELGPSGIRVNAVAPGAIDTDMMSGFSADEKALLADRTALCRMGTAEDVARAIALLAGDDAAFITGQILGVDGALVI